MDVKPRGLLAPAFGKPIQAIQRGRCVPQEKRAPSRMAIPKIPHIDVHSRGRQSESESKGSPFRIGMPRLTPLP